MIFSTRSFPGVGDVITLTYKSISKRAGDNISHAWNWFSGAGDAIPRT
jgi:hypothetical protein